MARLTGIAAHVAALLGTQVHSTSPLAGGDICLATRVRLTGGRSVFVKSKAGAPEGFFATEARDLAWLAEAGEGAVPVPKVLAHDAECLVLEWIETAKPSRDAAERFGRALAAMHRSGADRFGAAADGFTGTLVLPNEPMDSWSEFFVARRVEPFLRSAFNRGALEGGDAKAIIQVTDRLDELSGPPEKPARLHGDLWSGNIVWATDGQPRLVDPAAYGGHREQDLAMLTLFGAPQLDRILGAYDDAFPLADGWRDRLPIYQLHPLLVHATIFGGGYGARAGAAAREMTSGPRARS